MFKLSADCVSNWSTWQPINCPTDSVIDSVSEKMINYLTKQPTHIDSINKILGEAKISKKYWLPWLTDRKMLAFYRPRTDQMALKLLLSFGNSFKHVPGFSCLSKRFLHFFFLFTRVQFKMKLCRPWINLYITSFSESTNTVAICLWKSIKWMVKCKTATRYIHIFWITLIKMSQCLFSAVSFIKKFIRNISWINVMQNVPVNISNMYQH